MGADLEIEQIRASLEQKSHPPCTENRDDVWMGEIPSAVPVASQTPSISPSPLPPCTEFDACRGCMYYHSTVIDGMRRNLQDGVSCGFYSVEGKRSCAVLDAVGNLDAPFELCYATLDGLSDPVPLPSTFDDHEESEERVQKRLAF